MEGYVGGGRRNRLLGTSNPDRCQCVAAAGDRFEAKLNEPHRTYGNNRLAITAIDRAFGAPCI